jgi:sporulation integral membrane protein YtvI
LAFAAEPLVGLFSKKLPRAAAAGIGVCITLVLMGCVFFLLMALLVKEMGILAGALPNLEQTATEGLSSLENFLLELTDRTPAGIRPLLSQTVTGLLSDGTAVVDRLTRWIPGAASRVLGHIPGSAITLGTGILSGFMVSARLPKLKVWFQERIGGERLQKWLPVFSSVRGALGGFLKAQLKLSALCFLIVLCGFFLLNVPYAPIWALFTAVVDAIPVLGTGTVLIPWSLVCFLQGNHPQAIGLLGIYVVAFLARTILEPRLVGTQLGLDPLMTLAALYAGYRVWGFGGMLLSPLLCVTAMELIAAKNEK